MNKPKNLLMEINVIQMNLNPKDVHIEVLGKVSESSLAKLELFRSLSAIEGEGKQLVFLFVARGDFDIEIGHYFDVIWKLNNPDEFQRIGSSLYKVTDNMNLQLPCIPAGWRTIGCFEMITNCDLCNKLPILHSWEEGIWEERYIISSETFWESARKLEE
jgi:hypothetical protein